MQNKVFQHFLEFYRAGKSGGNDVGVQPLVKIEHEEMRATDSKKKKKEEQDPGSTYTLNRNAENFHKNVRILDSASPEAVRGVIDVNQHHSLLFVIDEFDVRLHEKITKITKLNSKI